MSTNTGIWSTLLGWLPNWLGFSLVMLAGAVLIVAGIAGGGPHAGYIAFGIAAIAAAILAWIASATGKPDINPNPKKWSFGGTLERVPDWAWFITFGLFVAAALVAIFTR